MAPPRRQRIDPEAEPQVRKTVTRAAPAARAERAAPAGRPGRPSNAQKALQAVEQERAQEEAILRAAEAIQRKRGVVEEPVEDGGDFDNSEFDEIQPEDEVQAAAPPRRTAPRPPREAPREAAREPARRGAVVVKGRDGQVLTRRRATSDDIYFVSQQEIPTGWSYQWNPFMITGQEAVEEQLQMAANGWRPVPAKRHAGKWTPHGHEGAIIVKGLRLEERPIQLTAEAKAEDIGHARAQVRDQTDTLKLSQKLPSGMAINRKYRGTGGDVRISIDRDVADIPRPEHQLAGED